MALFCSSPMSGSEAAIETEETSIRGDPVTTMSSSSSILNDNTATDLHTQQAQIPLISTEQPPVSAMLSEVVGSVGGAGAVGVDLGSEHSVKTLPYSVIDKTELPAKIEKPKDTGFKKFLKGNWLVIGEVMVIMMAKMNPSFGATGGRLRPEFFVSKLGVFTIFFINGIALSIGERSERELWSAFLSCFRYVCVYGCMLASHPVHRSVSRGKRL